MLRPIRSRKFLPLHFTLRDGSRVTDRENNPLAPERRSVFSISTRNNEVLRDRDGKILKGVVTYG